MKLKYLLFTVLIGSIMSSSAQKYITKTGLIELNSSTPVNAIRGVNNAVASILDTEIGEIYVSTLIHSFKFDKTVVEERVNEKYIESDKFPKATFQGKITDYKKINFLEDGDYNITIEGKLTIHGVTNYIKERGELTIKNGVIVTSTEFLISLKSYKIKVENVYQIDDVILIIRFIYRPYST